MHRLCRHYRFCGVDFQYLPYAGALETVIKAYPDALLMPSTEGIFPWEDLEQNKKFRLPVKQMVRSYMNKTLSEWCQHRLPQDAISLVLGFLIGTSKFVAGAGNSKRRRVHSGRFLLETDTDDSSSE